jgi:hypothetical protein
LAHRPPPPLTIDAPLVAAAGAVLSEACLEGLAIKSVVNDANFVMVVGNRHSRYLGFLPTCREVVFDAELCIDSYGADLDAVVLDY